MSGVMDPRPAESAGQSDEVVIELRRPYRTRVILLSLAAPSALSLLATQWVVEASRPILALLAYASWVLWAVSTVRALTVTSVALDWAGSRGPFAARRITPDEATEIAIERAGQSVSSITLRNGSLRAVCLDGPLLEENPEAMSRVLGWMSRFPEKVRESDARIVSWV